MIVTIDGPAGAGKSSIARLAATRLGFAFLDTGAMYRCVTHAALQQTRSQDAADPWSDPERLLQIAEGCQIDFDDGRVLLNGEDVSDAIRTPEVTRHIRFAADHPQVRTRLNVQQRRIAAGQDIVTEGRDQGTEVFPDAECKIFLTASPEVRAQRRQQQLAASGKQVQLEEVLADQNRRDLEDRLREVGRLRPAEDAVVVNTDGLQPDEVLEKVLQIVRQTAT
ncbi:(d)CMP kinase [Roseimaritima ulvae]|uniref:Cytidylate kinase n=1 Tax=Roseimaritima ulvae TaxID=980254 RepID=A0A5B9QWH9_9BACT|nr:(d)CMP kinase [Roseimaritima ulvae]QEG42342.1 Cytidylate kinase [Roseimaritima ulvae]